MIRTLALIALAAISLSIFTARVVTPTVTGTTAIVIDGASMGKTIPFGSLAYIKGLSTDPIRGDIITFRSGTHWVTHRVIDEVSGKGVGPWMTRGDGNEVNDTLYLERKQILGKVIAYLPAMGLITNILSSPAVIAFVLLAALALLAWPSIVGSATPDTVMPAKRT